MDCRGDWGPSGLLCMCTGGRCQQYLLPTLTSTVNKVPSLVFSRLKNLIKGKGSQEERQANFFSSLQG